MRKPNGQFTKGHAESRATQFKKGAHWRNPKPHWKKEWMEKHYIKCQLSALAIATLADCTEANVLYWLRKHGIPRRTTREVRKIKKWGMPGSANGMYGRTGEDNPRYVDGSSPERQRLYAQGKGKDFLSTVLRRDEYCCQRCQAPKKGARSLHVHHIMPWAGNKNLRFDLNNVVTVCDSCHNWIHSKKNTKRAYLND